MRSSKEELINYLNRQCKIFEICFSIEKKILNGEITDIYQINIAKECDLYLKNREKEIGGFTSSIYEIIDNCTLNSTKKRALKEKVENGTIKDNKELSEEYKILTENIYAGWRRRRTEEIKTKIKEKEEEIASGNSEIRKTNNKRRRRKTDYNAGYSGYSSSYDYEEDYKYRKELYG